MPENTYKLENNIEEKLKYINLNLKEIPDILKKEKKVSYQVLKEFDETTYKVYKYVSVNDIEIFITPMQRLVNLKEKYKKSIHISKYLEEDSSEYKDLVKALENTNIEDVLKIEEEQNLLQNNTPWNIKYKNNFKWQIYYSKDDNKYFMLAPLNEKDNSTLFYLIKEKINAIKSKKAKKLYIPICQLDYSYDFITKQQIADIENYLWFFTKKWPSIYEVYDTNSNKTLQIVGKTNVYENIESTYKLILKTKEDAEEKYKLMKALFIIASDLKYIYNFECDITEKGILQFLYKDKVIEFKDLETFIKNEVNDKINETKETIEDCLKLEIKLDELKQENERKNQEFNNKEKQIVTFLQCKKTFIGRFKYFFKSKKSKKRVSIKGVEDLPKILEYVESESDITSIPFDEKERYTIEDLISICHILERKKQFQNDKNADIKSLEDKINILNKKIENADIYIQEIESHKRSIFEFWKFTNKDLPNTLTEAEKLENEKKKVKKVFKYNEDINELGKMIDELQKKELSKNEIDTLYIIKDYIDIINILGKSEIDKDDNLYINSILKNQKKEYEETRNNKDVIYFDIFGNIDKDPRQIEKQIKQEKRNDKFDLLQLELNTTIDEFKETLTKYKRILEKEYNKITIPYDIPVYSLLNQNTMGEWTIATINPENVIKADDRKEILDIMKYNVPEKSPMLFYTNNILYKGNGITKGIGNETEVLLYLNEFDRELTGKVRKRISIEKNEYENIVRTIKIYEYKLKPKDEKSNITENIK